MYQPGILCICLAVLRGGPSGAQNLWAAGTYSTDHSRKVMDRFDYWTSVLED